MTISDFIAIVRKPGKIVMPIMAGEDVIYVAVNKSDFLETLENMNKQDRSPWKIYGTHKDGSLHIDLAR